MILYKQAYTVQMHEERQLTTMSNVGGVGDEKWK